ncbi:hypothetical protein [Roseateles koreensis]|uniref:DUF1330 domain-containing protein n=1 Tax=Roseateles koreensis TaxID=2987526 RepID=A0ABT5KWA5_9BURK|nr:hypothetical protein [Roseateles koreensis]MDC8787233.1 hypothetical protein [Roseateles koreensis]
MKLVRLLGASMGAALVIFAQTYAAPALADSSYTPGSVWSFSNIHVEPGQFENYMDYLAGNYKKQNEFLKKEGVVLSYHVLQVNAPRSGEPDLVLAIEYKDYASNAERLAIQKKMEAMMAMDAHKMDSASGERKVMRKLGGNMELQELKLK